MPPVEAKVVVATRNFAKQIPNCHHWWQLGILLRKFPYATSGGKSGGGYWE
jgi:hypothetical protein